MRRLWATRAPRAAGVLRAAVGTLACGWAIVVYSWITLPDVRVLRRGEPGQTAFMALRAAEADAAGQPGRTTRIWVPLDRISPLLQRAVVVSEDAGFWGHTGIDMAELRIAFSEGLGDGDFRGASTLTQQLAKNFYLSPSRNPLRKLTELLLARRLEAELPKRRILELYLNVVEWGDGLWGAEAAARTYFGIPAASLDAGQAALLAGALINPRVYNPGQPNARLLRRQAIILRRM
ncbi:MAG TPA: monofunctional biosynthetic peptidoglycan transglycosylase [Vicinamibacterales bacterium]|nr:monofunctional biosynthetic peptidoglycan transglycosylase [Vicinamibacterales bacterium]